MGSLKMLKSFNYIESSTKIINMISILHVISKVNSAILQELKGPMVTKKKKKKELKMI
jgi:hypothetical protein